MGEVYLAQDTRVGGAGVALKLLPPQFTMNAERVRRFEQEARTASALNHPNIVTIHEIGGTNGAQFIVTEFVEGVTLRQRMTERRFGPATRHLTWPSKIASALEAAHARESCTATSSRKTSCCRGRLRESSWTLDLPS